MERKQMTITNSPIFFFFLLMTLTLRFSSSQKICPNCGFMKIPYPLSTNPSCGDPDYSSFHCDLPSQKLYFNALNRSSYLVLKINASSQRMIVQPSRWVPGSCVTQDMVTSEGLWLNQTLPFNVTSSNTVFLFNCSPRLLVSPLNCTPSSLCHKFLQPSAGHVDRALAFQCAKDELNPCCTFLAGGMPSAYKIRLHKTGCKAFRSVINLDPRKPASQWEEGLEVQWASPLEPSCKTQLDCSNASTCTPAGTVHRCLCNKGHYWDNVDGVCMRIKKSNAKVRLIIPIIAAIILLILLLILVLIFGFFTRRNKFSYKAKMAKAREDLLRSSNGGKPARIFYLKEIKKATNNFSNDNVLGSGGFGEVYKGQLQDGSIVAVKSAKVGNIKSTQQVLNEVAILSQVNHKNLVRLLGCCVEAVQPLMIYEYISNGTLHDHLHSTNNNNSKGIIPTFLTWKMRLKIAIQTAEALAYLHSSAYNPIYHRDVKSNNILLDDAFNAKVSDFGLSRLALPGLSHVSTCAQGTLGYLDPEYYRNYQLTDKSDVYSYGVVLLELLTSKKAIDFSRNPDDVNLAIYVNQRAKDGGVTEVVDRLLVIDNNEEGAPGSTIMRSMDLFLGLGFGCLREKKKDRPNMIEVVQELQRIIEIVNDDEIRVCNDPEIMSVDLDETRA